MIEYDTTLEPPLTSQLDYALILSHSYSWCNEVVTHLSIHFLCSKDTQQFTKCPFKSLPHPCHNLLKSTLLC